MKRIRDHYSATMATAAFVIALTTAGAAASGVLVTSKQIKNGTVSSVDLRNNNVKSADLQNGTVSSADIGNGEVEPVDVSMPGPKQCQLSGEAVLSEPTTDFQKLATVCTYTKEAAESVLSVEWTGAIEGHNGGELAGCVYQLRVNGQPSGPNAGEVLGKGLTSVSASALFSGLATGTYEIEIWARIVVGNAAFNSCAINPAKGGTSGTVDVEEVVV